MSFCIVCDLIHSNLWSKYEFLHCLVIWLILICGWLTLFGDLIVLISVLVWSSTGLLIFRTSLGLSSWVWNALNCNVHRLDLRCIQNLNDLFCIFIITGKLPCMHLLEFSFVLLANFDRILHAGLLLDACPIPWWLSGPHTSLPYTAMGRMTLSKISHQILIGMFIL